MQADNEADEGDLEQNSAMDATVEYSELEADLRKWFEESTQNSAARLACTSGVVDVSALSKRYLPPGNVAMLYLDYVTSKDLVEQATTSREPVAKCTSKAVSCPMLLSRAMLIATHASLLPRACVASGYWQGTSLHSCQSMRASGTGSSGTSGTSVGRKCSPSGSPASTPSASSAHKLTGVSAAGRLPTKLHKATGCPGRA